MQDKLPQKNTFRDRAEECRKLVKISPQDMKAGFLRLAKAYEALAEQTKADGYRLERHQIGSGSD
jgi:hypothetical protein